MKIDESVRALQESGVNVVDPRQVYVADDVDLTRIHGTATLHPGTRLHGARTLLSAGVEVGAEGPTTLRNAVLGPRTRISSGYLEGVVCLDDVSVGANAHFRPGTLLEEAASTAHCVGLKETILLSFVTVGSLVNVCDLLISGGSSRRDHSEVGSGFIHFNFTPWGLHGDKATPSLVGDVPSGVLLRSDRIFLGGAGGIIGPLAVGFGSVSGAGQVLRKDVSSGRLVVRKTEALDRDFTRRPSDRRIREVWKRNAEYIGQLHALAVWYRKVRMVRCVENGVFSRRLLIEESLNILEYCIRERLRQLEVFLSEYGLHYSYSAPESPLCPLSLANDDRTDSDHVHWVQSLTPKETSSLRQWLQSAVDSVRTKIFPEGNERDCR